MTINKKIAILENIIKNCNHKDKKTFEYKVLAGVLDNLKEYLFLTASLGVCLNTIRENTDNNFIENLDNEVKIYNIAVENILGVDDNAKDKKHKQI